MGIRQLEEFLGQADQKGFWIFSYANLGGGFFGAFVGNSLLDKLAPSFKLLGIALGVLLGVLITWKVKGHPIYRWALSYAMFLLRRYLKVGMGDFTIDAGQYYRSRAVSQEPFMLVTTRNGRPVPVLVHRGSGPGASTHLFDDLLVPIQEEGEWRSVSGIRSPGTADARTISPAKIGLQTNNGHSPQQTDDEHISPDYSDWDL
jgi:hypothetical protein